ncbi:hypothetical protein AAG906_005918 [Vitis piasezkii]
MRLRRVIWNPWQSNGKLKNMKNQSFKVLCHKEIRNARRGIMSATFGSLLEVQFMHAIFTTIASRSLQAEGRILHVAKSPFCCEMISQPFACGFPLKRHPLVISCELLMGNPRLKITLNGAPAGHESTDTPIGHESHSIYKSRILEYYIFYI